MFKIEKEGVILMGKGIIRWIVTSLLTGLVLYSVTSVIAQTTLSNLFQEFEVLLMLIGFSTSTATILTCTKLIIERINKLNES